MTGCCSGGGGGGGGGGATGGILIYIYLPIYLCLYYLSVNPSDEDSVSTQIGSEFKDLLRGMLDKSPIARLNLEKVVLHPWCHHGAENKQSEANVGDVTTR
jgi:hypothetical protein